MRPLARQIVVNAAVSAGLDKERVVDKPKKANKVLSAKPRLEFETIDEGLNRSGGLSDVLPGDDPQTHLKKRKRIYKRNLKVRVAIVADDETWLENFVVSFLAAIPHYTGDESGNQVTVEANRAQRGGFETQTVEVFKEREAAIWIDFTGGIYLETEVPLIRSVDLVKGVTIE